MGASKNKDILKKVLDFAMSVSYFFICKKKYDNIIFNIYILILFCFYVG